MRCARPGPRTSARSGEPSLVFLELLPVHHVASQQADLFDSSTSRFAISVSIGSTGVTVLGHYLRWPLHSNSTSGTPGCTSSPSGRRWIDRPSRGALTGSSIFIASSAISTSPRETRCPGHLDLDDGCGHRRRQRRRVIVSSLGAPRSARGAANDENPAVEKHPGALAVNRGVHPSAAGVVGQLKAAVATREDRRGIVHRSTSDVVCRPGIDNVR